jgi:AbrB family looped-hinge helix DNA binding protein
METTLDRFGRVIIPKGVRDRLGLEPGAVLEVHDTGGEILLRPHLAQPSLVKKGRVLVYTGKTGSATGDALRAVREGRLKKLGVRATR